ncbi:hypothetical protein DRW07_10385 [Alteromonas sediminis]|uniref:OmpR/PhoB-type domain-containing protein n=1 Tax=Alteromonas sediminis TaxID=2259342 RepID=A0A3N5Y0S3_9ALTE|nr:winged helix-turn-helix domain-containing protein [Alteromonas sediminis]RPJ66493.1 hypothetical protein DRW07_10385 [Alteromonas sediminis]
MAQQFWVNNYYIDITRNQIHHQEQATHLPPKALKVLAVLASRAGEVVSHDELMALVWANSVVGPNTLQRAIAQLRKAFGDDSKQQAFIKTHAKKGYSLEANVRWEESNVAASQTESLPDKGSARRNWLLAIPMFVMLLVGVWVFWPIPQLYDQVTPLTASDEQEYNAAYSPDGKYLVFNRFVGQCESHLWAKDLNNGQEVRLSTEPGTYGQVSWSTDGTQLAFIKQSTCADVIEQNTLCWQLQTLDFAQAWNGNGQNQLRYDCADTETTHPTWMNDGRIAMLYYADGAQRSPNVMIYDPIANQANTLELAEKGDIYALDYARETELLAVVMLLDSHEHRLLTFTPDGEIQSLATIQRKAYQSVYDRFPIRFTPDGESFLTEVNGRIYRLDLEGELNPINTVFQNDLSMPRHHPTENKIAVTHGVQNYDVGVLTLDNDKTTLDFFARSTSTDINARFQPGGELIAYVSYRSGHAQIWIADGDKSYQLTQFENGIYGSLFSWSPDGRRIVVNLNNQLAVVKLNGDYQVLNTMIPVFVLMPWTQHNHMLVTSTQTQKAQLFQVDMQTAEVKDLQVSNVMWAAYIEDGTILYADYQKQFWLLSGEGRKALPTISNKLVGKNALLEGSYLYGIDMQDQLWRYQLNTNELQHISTINKDIMLISDIKNGQILASQFVGGRRELLELSPEAK